VTELETSQVIAEAEFNREVNRNFRWNFAVNTLDIAFIMFGLNLISQATIMPLLVSQLTSSKIIIGLIPAVYSLAFLLPQLLTANYTEGLRRKKPFTVLMGGLGERTPWLWIGFVLWFLAKSAPTAALVGFFFFLAMSAACSGICTPAWYDMIAKVIPLKKRGLWAGVSNSLGAFLGIAGAGVAGSILVGWAFPQNFAICFFLAFTATAISWVGLALNREPVSPTIKPPSTLHNYLKQLPGVLRRDHNYIRFLASRTVANLGGMAAGFFMVYGMERFSFSGVEVGALTGVLIGSQAVMNLLLGAIGDRHGHKGILVSVSFSLALASAAAWLASSPAWMYVTFALLGVAYAGYSVSGMNIILEFCAPQDRPTYIGLTNTLLAPGVALAPLIGGWLATWLGYRPMFVAAVLVSLLGGLLVAWWVREPRHESEKEPLSRQDEAQHVI
jgi:MFS family permease